MRIKIGENGLRFGSYDDPFDYTIFRNCFPESMFQTIQSKVRDFPKTPPDKRRTSKFIINEEIDGYIYDPWLYDKLNELFREAVGGIDYKHYIPIFEYNSCPAGYSYPIHVDAPEKIVSLVIYISDRGNGTVLYDKNKKYVKELEWTPNDGFLFYRDDDTYHSYHSTVNHRDTINCILVKRDKELLRNLRYEGNV